MAVSSDRYALWVGTAAERAETDGNNCDAWYESDSGLWYIWDGTEWVALYLPGNPPE